MLQISFDEFFFSTITPNRLSNLLKEVLGVLLPWLSFIDLGRTTEII